MRPAGEELDLHRMTVDEAVPCLEEYLYRAYQSGLRRVWIVHGKGSGVLRREVGRYLGRHPLVESYAQADSRHGGAGATEVRLSDR